MFSACFYYYYYLRITRGQPIDIDLFLQIYAPGLAFSTKIPSIFGELAR